MSKKIVCFLLALIMVLGMIPNAAISANAYSQLSTSESAINVLLNSTWYGKPQGGLLGYSTPASAADQTKYATGITKEEAVDLLRKYVKDNIDKDINAFVKSKNIDLTAGQHNALAINAYRAGGFANVNANLMNAIVARKTGNEMLAAFVGTRSHNVTSTEALKTSLDLVMCEAGMYLNGSYSVSGLSYAIKDINGNEKADASDELVVFVNAKGLALNPLSGSDFLGWYVFDGKVDGKIEGNPITKLDSTHNGKLIVAKKGADNTNVAADYTISSASLVELNVYNGSLDKITGTLKYNTNFKVTLESMVSGVKWVYGTGTDTNNKSITGWVKIGKHADAEAETLKPIATATPKNDIAVYDGATKNSTNTGKVAAKGVSINIYEIKVEATNTGNQNWGKVIIDGQIGWINLALATVNETMGETGSAVGQTGVITNTDEVNIRSSAEITGTNKIASLKRGTKVTVLELTADSSWAKIKWTEPANGYTQGWVYMHYVQMDNAPEINTGSGSSNGTVLYTGVVTSNINLNVREYADVYASKVGSLANGTKINVYEVETSRGMKWGRIGDEQWVCLSYVSLTEVAQPSTGSGSNGSSTTTSVQATVKTTTLDVYKNYNSNSEKVGSLKKGDVVTILERNTETTSTGTRIWGRFDNGTVAGWINLAYTDVKTVTSVTGGTTDSTTGTTSNANGADAVVANCISVNVRTAAGVYNTQITKLNAGTKIKVYDRVTKDNAPWAKITWDNGAKEGWVCMNYVTMGSTSAPAENGSTVNGTNSNTISVTGYVNSNIDLKVRAGAGLGYAQIGALKKGTKVSVYEQMTADGLIWGRTAYGNTSGWICMSYITVENTSSSGKGVMGTVARCFAAVNVRSAPGTNNALVAKINVGTRVEVFETKTYSNQLWGRVAQGWVCMDYILLDAELPEGTILDATVPTTGAAGNTQATEAPDEVVTAGAVKYAFTTTTLIDKNVYNDADEESTKVGTVGDQVKIKGIKMNGKEAWGLIDEYGTAGWVNLSKATYSINGYVNTDNQAVYADNYSTVKGTLNINTNLTITKVSTDGSKVYGWVEASIFGWIPMDKVSDKAVENAVKVYRSGDTAGTGTYITGKTYAAMDALESIGGTKVLFKLESGVNVNVSAVRFFDGKVWGQVAATEGTAWINLGNVNYSVALSVSEPLEVRTSKDDTTKATDEQNNIKGSLSAGNVNFCQMQFDGKGNVWAVVTGYYVAELNGHYVMIRTTSDSLVGNLVIG